MTIKIPVEENRPFYGKFWPKGVPHQLDYDYSWTINDMLEDTVKKFPNDPVKAWVSLKPEHAGTITEKELHAWCFENITHWKAPKYLKIIDQISKNIIGKVQRRFLQKNDPLYEKKE